MSSAGSVVFASPAGISVVARVRLRRRRVILNTEVAGGPVVQAGSRGETLVQHEVSESAAGVDCDPDRCVPARGAVAGLRPRSGYAAGGGAAGRVRVGAGAGRRRPPGRGARPRARHDAVRGRGAGALPPGDRAPPRRIHGGDGRRRFPRAAADDHRVPGARRRALDRRHHQPGRGQPAGPAADRHPVVQRQHAADQRRVYGRQAGDAAEPGSRPHAGAGERQAPSPLVDHRLARRQRRRLRVAGARHLGHSGHRAATGGGAAGRGGGPVRVGRHRRRDELPAQGRRLRRHARAQHGRLRRGRRRGVQRGRQRRAAARRERVRQPQPGVRQLEPDQPQRAPQRRESRSSRPATRTSSPTPRRSGARRRSTTT